MSLIWLTVSLALIFVAMAALAWMRSQRLEQRSGLPPGRVIYADNGVWHPNQETLLAPSLRLAGKPDYLVQQNDGLIIPVELKSSRAPREPWEGHVLQLAAYCLLAEETYGIRPTHGILQYKDRAFTVAYTAELEQDLLITLEEMRQDSVLSEISRDHDEARRCQACSYRERCSQRLA